MTINFNSLNKGLVLHLPLDKVHTKTGTQNLVTNGTFTTDTGWSKETGWSINVGTGKADCDGSQIIGTSVYQSGVVTAGRSYSVTYTISNYSAGLFNINVGGLAAGTVRSANGTYTQTFIANGITSIFLTGNVDFVGSIDNVEVYDVTGTVCDLSAQGNHGSRIGTTWTTDRFGVADKALAFNGTSDYVTFSDNPISGDVDFSISSWLYDNDGDDNFGGVVLGEGNVSRQSAYIGTNAGVVLGGLYGVNISSTVASQNTWRHAVLTHDASANLMYLYVDGVFINSGATGATNIQGEMSIGRFLSGVTYAFKGSIDEVRIYNRALSQAEVTALYQAGGLGNIIYSGA